MRDRSRIASLGGGDMSPLCAPFPVYRSYNPWRSTTSKHGYSQPRCIASSPLLRCVPTEIGVRRSELLVAAIDPRATTTQHVGGLRCKASIQKPYSFTVYKVYLSIPALHILGQPTSAVQRRNSLSLRTVGRLARFAHPSALPLAHLCRHSA